MKGNIYESNLAEAWDLFGSYAQGSKQALVCVVSRHPLAPGAKQALSSSAEQFGYGTNACTFLSLTPTQGNEEASFARETTSTEIRAASESAHGASGDSADNLDASALFMAIEGFDPLCLIAADSFAARALQEAYRCEVRTQSVNRIFGRTAVAFVDFPRMLKSAQDKQRAWTLLKQLPRFGDVQ